MLKKKLLKTKMLWKMAALQDAGAIPPIEELDQELTEMFKTVLLTEDRKNLVRNLDPKSKWKLIKNHKKFLENNKDVIRLANSKEIMNVVGRIKSKASLVDLQEIKRWLLKATEFQVKSFCIYDGVKFLFQRLSEAEMVSRSNKNYKKQIEILKLLELLSKLENGVQETLKCKNAVYYLLLNLHPYNVEITSITLEILDNVIWESNVAIDLVLDGLTKIKNERNFQYRFFPLITILRKSKNVIIVNNVLTFINDFISAPTEEEKRMAIRSEFLSCGITESFEFIRGKINTNEYIMEDCMYDNVQKLLSRIKYDPASSNIGRESPFNTFKGVSGAASLLLKFKTSPNKSTSSEELNTSDTETEFDRVEESQKIFERDFYLKVGDYEAFENRMQGILGQIDAFNGLCLEEKNDKFLDMIQKILGKNKDVTDIKEIIEKIKENVLKRENFNTFLTIMQKLLIIPQTNNGDKIWAKVQRYLENLIVLHEEEKEGEEHDEINANTMTVEELEGMLGVRDKEIKKHIEEKNMLLHRIEQLVANEKDLKNKLELQINFTKNAHREVQKKEKTIVQLEIEKAKSPMHSPTEKMNPLKFFLNLGGNKPLPTADEVSTDHHTKVTLVEEKKPNILPPPPLNVLLGEGFTLQPQQIENKPPPIQPPPLNLLIGGVVTFEQNQNPPPIMPPPLGLLTGTEIGFTSNQIPPPPIGLLGDPTTQNQNLPPGPPPLSLLLGGGPFMNQQQMGPPGPPPLGLLLGEPQQQQGGPPGPPPLNLLLGGGQPMGGPPGPPPLGLLLGQGNPPGPPPLGMLLGQGGPPPLGMLLGQGGPQGGPPGPPPLGMLLGQGGPPGPPPLGALLGGGPPMPPNLFGGPPMPPNIFGGPPMPPNLLGGPPGPPNLFGGPGGPPPIGLLGKGGPPPIGLGFGGIAQMGMMGARVKEKKKPRVPVRGVMWSIMKFTEIKNTIFEKLDDEKLFKHLDIDRLEKEFQKKEDKPVANAAAAKPKVEKISLIKPERAKLFDIMLVKMKCSIPSIANALIIMDESIITLGNLDLLLPAIPNEEEVSQCKAYKGDYDLLANPEKLITEISKVKGFQHRIKGLQFQKVYKEFVDDLSMKCEVLAKVWGNMRKDTRIDELFEYVLATGNYLNGTSNRGGAYGFKFDGLEKIVDCKSTINPKKNLLMFILESIEEHKKAALIQGNEDLSEYDLATKVPISQLEADLSEIKKGFKAVEQAIASKTDDPIDKIADQLADSAKSLSANIAEMDQKIKMINQEYQETLKHFAEDGKEGSDKVAKKFLQMFQYCINNKKELEKFRLALKKEAEKKLKEEQKKQLQDLRKSTTKPSEKKAVEGLTTVSRMDSKKAKNGEDVLNDLAARRENKKNKAAAISEEEGGLFVSMFSRKLKKDLEETNNKEGLENIKNEKMLGDLQQMLMQGMLAGNK